MPSKVYRDLIGSTQRNTETTYGAEAERRVFVRVDMTEPAQNTTLLGRAIEKAVGTEFYHPDDPSLPLQRATAKQIGNNTCEVILEYKRSRTSSGPLDVPSTGGVVYNSRARMGAKNIYKDQANNWLDATNRDATDPTKALDQDNPPRSRAIQVPEEEITVPVILNSYQFPQLQAAKNDIGKVNSNVLQFAGHTFAEKTMLNTGIDVDWQSQQTLGALSFYVAWGGNNSGIVAQLVFIVQYKFRYRPYNWTEQVISYNGTEWVVTSNEVYEAVNMSGYPI